MISLFLYVEDMRLELVFILDTRLGLEELHVLWSRFEKRSEHAFVERERIRVTFEFHTERADSGLSDGDARHVYCAGYRERERETAVRWRKAIVSVLEVVI